MKTTCRLWSITLLQKIPVSTTVEVLCRMSFRLLIKHDPVFLKCRIRHKVVSLVVMPQRQTTLLCCRRGRSSVIPKREDWREDHSCTSADKQPTVGQQTTDSRPARRPTGFFGSCSSQLPADQSRCTSQVQFKAAVQEWRLHPSLILGRSGMKTRLKSGRNWA